MTTQRLTNRCSEPLAAPMAPNKIMKTPAFHSALVAASGR
jgi:hypothetical protein